jgi:hypothetical protein
MPAATLWPHWQTLRTDLIPPDDWAGRRSPGPGSACARTRSTTCLSSAPRRCAGPAGYSHLPVRGTTGTPHRRPDRRRDHRPRNPGRPPVPDAAPDASRGKAARSQYNAAHTPPLTTDTHTDDLLPAAEDELRWKAEHAVRMERRLRVTVHSLLREASQGRAGAEASVDHPLPVTARCWRTGTVRWRVPDGPAA